VRLLFLALSLAAAVHASPACAQAGDEALRLRFGEAMQMLESGKPAEAEVVLREMLRVTDSPRLRLELARALYLQGNYMEAKMLFRQVSVRADTPWRVVDNIAHFVRDIEERTGYLKFGITMVSDSNPRNLAVQKEFSLGGLRVTPTEAPKKLTGMRYAMRGWTPFGASGASGYLTASYTDFPGQDIDRLTADGGIVQNLSETGRVRGKAGAEFGTLDGARLYHYPYLGLDSVLAQSDTSRLTGELKLGKVRFADFNYLDAAQANAALAVRKVVAQSATLSFGASIEHSDARERPYSYTGWEAGPGIDMFWPQSTFLVGARATVGTRKYAAVDPLFGERRSDAKGRFEISLGNKQWRWRDNYVSLMASLERVDSNIGFYSYRKANASVVIE
jgi:hypothetical protein